VHVSHLQTRCQLTEHKTPVDKQQLAEVRNKTAPGTENTDPRVSARPQVSGLRSEVSLVEPFWQHRYWFLTGRVHQLPRKSGKSCQSQRLNPIAFSTWDGKREFIIDNLLVRIHQDDLVDRPRAMGV
jgi:hypothetical protein